MIGTIKRLPHCRKYGFIVSGDEEYFVDFVGNGEFDSGETVEFEPRIDNQGLYATDIKRYKPPSVEDYCGF